MPITLIPGKKDGELVYVAQMTTPFAPHDETRQEKDVAHGAGFWWGGSDYPYWYTSDPRKAKLLIEYARPELAELLALAADAPPVKPRQPRKLSVVMRGHEFIATSPTKEQIKRLEEVGFSKRYNLSAKADEWYATDVYYAVQPYIWNALDEPTKIIVAAEDQKALERLRKARGDFAVTRNIPVKDGAAYRQYQLEGIDFILDCLNDLGYCILADDTGTGKLLPDSEPVLTPDGWFRNDSLEVGDKVIGADGKPTQVVGVYPQGEQEIVRITFSDGSWCRCSWDHLWTVQRVRSHKTPNPWITMTTRELVDKGLTYGKIDNRIWRIPIVQPVEFAPRQFPLDPYLLGVLLGDGGLVGRDDVYITTDDWILAKTGLHHSNGNHKSKDITQARVYDAGGALRDTLDGLGLLDKHSWEKVVPPEYLLGSPAQRLALLQGLMDTDGYPMYKGGAEFCSTSESMVDAVIELVLSLGGIARGRRVAASTFTYKGEKKQGRRAERVNVKLPPEMAMFTLPRKAAKYVPATKYLPSRTVASVELDGVESARCIKVANEDGLYVTRSYIVTHNTIHGHGVINVLDKELKNVLVICPPMVKAGWRNEMQIFSTANHLLPVMVDANGWPDMSRFFGSGYGRLVIIHYHVLHKYKAKLDSIEWDLVIIDEYHRLTNKGARWSKAIMGGTIPELRDKVTGKLKRVEVHWNSLRFKRVVCTTGTTIRNKLMQSFSLYHWLNPKIWDNHEAFKRRYCKKTWCEETQEYDELNGNHLAEFQERLYRFGVIRREKKDVLKEIPLVQKQPVIIDMSEVNQIEDRMVAKMGLTREQFVRWKLGDTVTGKGFEMGDTVSMLRRNSIEQEARKDASLAIVPYAIPIIEEIIDDHKLLYFAYHRQHLEQIKEHFGDRAGLIYGGQKAEVNNEIVSRAWRDPSMKLVLMNMTMAEGINLQCIWHVLFGEPDYVPGVMEQCIGRIARYGQESDRMLAQFLLGEKSALLDVFQAQLDKQRIIHAALDERHEGRTA